MRSTCFYTCFFIEIFSVFFCQDLLKNVEVMVVLLIGLCRIGKAVNNINIIRQEVGWLLVFTLPVIRA